MGKAKKSYSKIKRVKGTMLPSLKGTFVFVLRDGQLELSEWGDREMG